MLKAVLVCVIALGVLQITISNSESFCHIPLKPEHGSVRVAGSDGRIPAGRIAIFFCNDGRILNGSTISKCLDNGQWTSPTPQCLEACNIPNVTGGVIGRYVREIYSENPTRIFKQVTVGKAIGDDEELFLRCSEGYEISGSENKEEKIICSRGKWSREAQCEPTSCNSTPPVAENAEVVALNPEHGGIVLYHCLTDFRKTVNETVICNFGRWKGNLPICNNTRCSVNDLLFLGLLKGRKLSYRDGEIFEIECELRYRTANAKQLRCVDGNWRGPLPPCIPASCTKPPPVVNHARAEVSSTVHNSFVKYICEDPYVLVGGKIQCLFGKWEGQLPTCEDARCSVNDLLFPGLMKGRKLSYRDGEIFEFECGSGYRAADEKQLRCADGKWKGPLPPCIPASCTKPPPVVDRARAEVSSTVHSSVVKYVCEDPYVLAGGKIQCLFGEWEGQLPTCEDGDCSVPRIYHGDMTEQRLGDTYWSWRKFKYVREVDYTAIRAGTVVPRATIFILICQDGYSFQGTEIRERGITCSAGRWLPDPVCLPVGAKYVPTTAVQIMEAVTTALDTSRSTTASSTSVSVIPTAASEPTSAEAVFIGQDGVTPITENGSPEEECFCEYPINDNSLVAQADGKRLKFHDRVKDGTVLVFRCEHVGYHRLIGPQEIRCENCRKWHTSDFPSCTEPKSARCHTSELNFPGLVKPKKAHLTRGETFKIKCERGYRESTSSKRMACSSNGKWSIEDNPCTIDITCRKFIPYNGLLIRYTNDNKVNSIASFRCIQGATLIGSNTSICLRTGIWSKPMPSCEMLEIHCPKIDPKGIFSIFYSNDRRINSTAQFFCKADNKKISGCSIWTCQRNGEWIGEYPTCADYVTCERFQSSPGLEVSYSDDVRVGSTASFRCSPPNNLLGNSFAICQPNGTWSHDLPSCEEPKCSIDTLMMSIPEGVIPDMSDELEEFHSRGSELRLQCEEDLILTGSSKAICGLLGEWEVGNVLCIPGCRLSKDAFPRLIIEPVKAYYRLGEIVLLSCPHGLKLTSEVERVMCLGKMWSDDIPNCIEAD